MILFLDLDNTIFDFNKASEAAFYATIANYNIPKKEDIFELYEVINHATWKRLEEGKITLQDVKRIRWQEFMSRVGGVGKPLEINDFYLKQLPKFPFLWEGANAFLEKAKANDFRMAAVTNGMKIVQRPRLAAANLTDYFETIVVSEEVGVAKPQGAFFEVAYKAMNKPPKEDILMVGDSLNSDIQGGNKFGLKTCWFNPNEKENTTEHQPDFEVKRLEEIWDLMGLRD